MQFNIEDMHCGGCVRGVTKAIHSVDPEAIVHADLDTRNVEVTSNLPREAFVPALDNAGFTVTPS